MNNLINMLRELHTTKNSPEQIREVLDYIAGELDEKKSNLLYMKRLIKDTKEYYSDGIDEELIDIINEVIGE